MSLSKLRARIIWKSFWNKYSRKFILWIKLHWRRSNKRPRCRNCLLIRSAWTSQILPINIWNSQKYSMEYSQHIFNHQVVLPNGIPRLSLSHRLLSSSSKVISVAASISHQATACRRSHRTAFSQHLPRTSRPLRPRSQICFSNWSPKTHSLPTSSHKTRSWPFQPTNYTLIRSIHWKKSSKDMSNK